MNILIVESEKHGHNLYLYLSSLLSKFSKKNKLFLIISHEIYADKSFQKLKKKLKFKTFKKNFPQRPHTYKFLKNSFYQIKYYFFLKKIFKDISDNYNFDHIYVNNINHFDKAISLLGSPFKNINFSVFYTNLNIYLGNERYSKKKLINYIYYLLFFKFFYIKQLKNIFISNPILKNFLKKKNLISKIRYVEEFSRLEKNRVKFNIFQNLNNKKKILVYGRIRDDKDIENLFKLLNYEYVRNNIVFIIAGNQETNISNFIEEKRKKFSNIISINKYIDSKLESYLFRNTDFVWIGYKKNFYGSSAVFFQASMANKKIICSSHGLVAWFNNLYKIGLSTNLNNSLKIINFLKSNKKINTTNYKKIKSAHNEQNFVNKIYTSIVKI